MSKHSHARLLTAFSCLFLAACSGGSAVGTWDLDVAAMKSAVEAMMQEQLQQAPPAQQEMMKQRIAQMAEGMTKAKGSIELTADGTALFVEDGAGGHQESKGTWKMEDGKVAMTGMSPGSQVAETRFGTVVGNELRIEEDGGDRKITLIFRRR